MEKKPSRAAQQQNDVRRLRQAAAPRRNSGGRRVRRGRLCTGCLLQWPSRQLVTPSSRKFALNDAKTIGRGMDTHDLGAAADIQNICGRRRDNACRLTGEKGSPSSSSSRRSTAQSYPDYSHISLQSPIWTIESWIKKLRIFH
jgi:hypothetical protein